MEPMRRLSRAIVPLDGLSKMKIFNSGLLIAALSVVVSCSREARNSPIPESHPAYRFYRIASSGPTTLNVCHSFGGVEIPPKQYERGESLGQGMFIITEKSTGKMFVVVSWSEGGFMSTINNCCWLWDPNESTPPGRRK